RAMGKTRLSGRVGAGLDPCGALQVVVDLANDQEREVAFILGTAPSADEARQVVQRWRGVEPAREALSQVWDHWKNLLGAVYVETPDPAVNMLANGWLLYQVTAARLFGRTGYYQSGGAFGF